MLQKMERIFFLLILVISLSQSSIFAQDVERYNELDAMFKSYEILNIDSRSFYQTVSTNRNGGSVKLRLNEKTEWNLQLENSGIISSEYKVTESTINGIVSKTGTTALPMKGYVTGNPNSRVSLTFNHDFIFGFIKLGTTTYFIEPINHFVKDKQKDKFVLYSVNDIIPGEEKICGYDHYLKEKDKDRVRVKSSEGARMPGLCYRVEIALAADFLMHQAYGNSTGVQNHNIGVLNNVQTNYDDEFADELQFALMEQWISTCSSCDPWTSSTDPGDLLDDFTSWGVSGFSVPFDVASLWSNRNFNGGTIGLAWVGAVCTNVRYNVLEDFSSNAELKRVLQAHELGHNFDANHTSGIMAPSVNTSTTWTSTNIAEIESYYNSVNCLSNCPASNAPAANFTYQLNDPCSPAEVEFTNLSTNSTSWLWTFDGGTPATSTLQNPIVTFTDGGSHDVTLQAFSGSTSNTIMLPIFVNLVDDPIAEFVYNVSGLQVNFIFTGSGATSYNWNFGYGSNTSSSQNPIHVFPGNGIYDITLTVNNQCGTSTVTYPVEISVVPFVNFSANVTTGCQPQTITFSNLSTNATSYLWTFQGGIPAASTETNPVVQFTNPGNFTVTLDATNNTGTNTLSRSDYINIAPSPAAGFNFNVAGAQATFTNTSQHGTTLSWNFGDNTTSTESNPTHTYLNNGIYAVTQTVTNSCGISLSTQAVTIAVPPVPSFTTSVQGPICAEESVQFTSTSTYGPTSYLWTFEGGSPSSSTDPDPLVVYNTPGIYDVTLVVTNANGTNQISLADYLVVNAKPTVSYTYLGDGLEVDFTQNISNGTGHFWNFGDGQTSTASNPTHIYGSEGTYTVTLSDINICGTTIFSQSIIVQLFPTAAFSANNSNICQNGIVQFNNLSSPSVTSWLWSFEGGNPATSTAINPSVQYNQTGQFNVSLTVSNQIGQNTTTITDFINVITVPTASFTGVVNTNNINLTNTGSGSTGSSWSVFNTNTNAQLNGNQVNYVAPENGSYNVILTNSNQCGQTLSDTVTYIVNAYPIAVFSVNNGGAPCNNGVNTFTANGTNGSSFAWTFENGTPSASTEQNPVVTYTLSGSFAVTLIVTNTLGSDTFNTTINVGSLPVPNFNSVVTNNQVAFNFTGSGQSAQTWNFGDGNTSTELNPTHTYATSGNYLVKLKVLNACGIDSISKNVSVIVSSVDEIGSKMYVMVQPNPSYSGLFNLIMKDVNTGKYQLTISDITGKQILHKNVDISDEYSETFDLQGQFDGVYLLQIKGQNMVKTIKLIIAK